MKRTSIRVRKKQLESTGPWSLGFKKSMKIHLIYVGVSKTLGMSPTIGPLPDGFSVEQQVLPIWLWVRTCENSGYQKVEEPPRCRVNYLKMCSDVSNHAHVGLHPSADLFWELPSFQLLKPGTQGGEEVMGRAAQLFSGMGAVEFIWRSETHPDPQNWILA